MKSIACYALHYGKEYLAWSIRSIQEAVDEVHIFYTERPSYGFDPGLQCPESEVELGDQARRFCTKPLFWHKGSWWGEGQHRDTFLQLAKNTGVDMVLVVDSDELWLPGSARAALEYAYAQNRAGRWMARFQNFWRSMNLEIHDHFTPIRVVDMRHPLDVDAHLGVGQPEPIYHFGYAQSEAIMRYKWTCHGHQAELRPGWFDQKFLAWTPELTDLHPTVNNLWDKAWTVSPGVQKGLDSILSDHPYRHLGVIR